MNILLFLKKILALRFVYKVKIIRILVLAFLFNLLFGLFFYLAEREVQSGLSLGDAIWWAMVTMTTVGYGDLSPQTFSGRFFIAYPCMIMGIGVIGYLVGAIAEIMLERASKKRKGIMKIKDRNHIIICNCPSVEKVILLVDELRADLRYSDVGFVVITDRFDEIPERFVSNKIKFVKGDPTKEEILFRANILQSNGIFVLASDPLDVNSDEKTFAIGTIIEAISVEKKVGIKVVVELVGEENFKMMKRSNVDGIVSLSGVTDCLLIQEFLDPGSNDAIKQIITNRVGSQIYVLKSRLEGHSILEVHKAIMESNSDLVVMGVRRNGEHILNPANDLMIHKDDGIILLAKNMDDFRKLEEKII